jgi:1-deoxy-D-xylulose-5-phosphate synthase
MEAEKREKILAVTAAMGIGTGLSAFGEKFPERYFDVGIAESHALTFAAGLAANGFTPYVAIYSTFLQRGYDNLLHDVALQNLPVKIFIDRAGLAASDGATHHGIFDVSFISHIPGVTLFAPSSFSSLRELTALASEIDGPVAIRYSNSSERTEDLLGLRPLSAQPLVRVYSDYENEDPAEYIFITYGSILKEVRGAQTLLNSRGIKTSVILLETLKPLDKVASLLIDACRKAKKIVFVEEGIKSGGAAERMRSQLIDLGLDLSKTEFKIAAIDDTFVNPDKPCNIYDYAGLSAEKLCKLMTN